MKTAQPVIPESVAAANISSMGAVPMSTSMLTSPFMGMNPMTHYLGHLPLPMMGAMPLAGEQFRHLHKSHQNPSSLHQAVALHQVTTTARSWTLVP